MSPRIYVRGKRLREAHTGEEWLIDHIDRDFVWVSQPGTVVIPFAKAVCDKLQLLEIEVSREEK